MRPRQLQDSLGTFVNTVLIPFRGGKEGGGENVEELNQRRTCDILPHAITPYDMVSNLDYGCNVYLAFIIGLIGKNNDGCGSAIQINSATNGIYASKILYHNMLPEGVDSVNSSM